MRVVSFGPHLDVMGGISSVVKTWLASQTIRQVDFHHLSTMVDGTSRQKLAEVARCELALLRLMADRPPPDLYHVHVAVGASLWRKIVFFRQALATGRPVVVHAHGGSFESMYQRNERNAAAMRWLFRNATAVVVLYRRFGELVREWTDGQARVVQIMNPVVVDDFTRPPGLPWPEAPTVLFMGYVGKRKGAYDLMRAVPAVLEAVPNARFRFGGNGEVEQVRALAEELGVSHAVDMLGWASGEDKIRAFRAADVYCMPSYEEAHPVAILEAMAASLPVVSTDVAGIPETVVDGRTGWLVRPGDVSAIADRLIRLLRAPAEARQMGAAGLARVRADFDHEHIVGQVVALWRTLDAERRAAAR